MSHSLIRIKGSLQNKPHLIEPESFNSIMEYVNSRIKGDADITKKEMASWADVDGDFSSRFYDETKTGFMSIDGPLTYRTSGWEAFCGGTSYEMLKNQMEYFVQKDAKTVAMIVDSGGGEAHGMMDSANYLRKLADENGIKIIAYVDGMSASAAYGISCIADEIIMSADSQVGSIGVLIQLMNNSKALEKAGIERTFITAGKDKVPFAEDGSFTEAFKEKLQHQVDELYEGFTSHVAQHRNLSVDAVKNTEANVFMSKDAIELGLADQIMTPENFHEYLATYAQSNLEGKTMGNPLKTFMKQTNNEDKAEMLKLEEMQAALTASQEQYQALTSQMGSLKELFEAQTEQLKSATEALAAIETAKAEALVSSRKAALAEVLPKDDLETAMGAYGQLPDAAFEFTVKTLKAAKDAAAQGEMMTELGGDGQDIEAEAVSTTEAIRLAGVAAAKALRK